MKRFYKNLKIFYIIAESFLFVVLIPVIIYNIINKQWNMAFIVFLGIILFSIIATFLLLYYRNIVIEITFNNNNTIVKTNGNTYVLPSKNFIEVKDADYYGRIFITYKDEQGERKFVFQKKYSPFKSYTLDIEEMKKHMVTAKFTK